MSASLLLTVLMARGHLLASPYPATAPSFEHDFAAAIALDAAESRHPAPDDTPQLAARIPALRRALADAAAARFDSAAAALVAHAAAHPDASESAWALRRAYTYWRALGRDPDAASTLALYEARHAAREPRTAAEFHWSRRLELAGEARRAHLRTWLARHADHGPPDLRVLAEAELAADLWRASCTRPWHGLCVTHTRAWREACRVEHVPVFSVVPRDPELRREALRLAAAATRHARDLDLARVAPWRRPALRAALGQAALVSADAALESVVALEFPLDLEFTVEDYKHNSGVPKWEREHRAQVRRLAVDTARFTAHMNTADRRLDLATRAAEAVAATRSAPAILTAMTRLALVYGEVQDEREFSRTSKPPAGRDPPQWACCLVDRPYGAIAQDLLRTCAALVREHHVTAPDITACFEGFGHLFGAEDRLTEFTGRD